LNESALATKLASLPRAYGESMNYVELQGVIGAIISQIEQPQAHLSHGF